ncbi:MAG TPA: mandelate racemase/muconate lactonizing enzyme family protein [Chloroflexota bacterium]|jgi:L-alanine-DL-glutamate epimerase-like enolase superfamily enzyme|nr:mandelate racemase/muconate lactonizing enzyme family protein [Chloroflexota bacterium]
MAGVPSAEAARERTASPCLIVAAIETEHYRVPQYVFSPTPLADTTHTIEFLDLIIATLQTEDGVAGMGYTYTTGHAAAAVKAMLDTEIAPHAVGRSCRDADRLWEEAWWRTHWAGRGGVSTLAMAAADIAFWDAQAVAAGLPLYRHLGAHRDHIRGYGSGVNLSLALPELVAQAEGFLARGFTGYKLKVGRATPREDAERLAALRATLGPDRLLLVDANMGWTLAEATRRVRDLERHDVYWLEEPLIPEDVAGHAALARSSPVPIAAGENLYTKHQFADYLRADALHIAQADVIRCGGITEWLKIAHLAQAANRPMAPHFVAELHVHLLCAIPNALILEYLPWFDALVEEPLVVHDGLFAPPDRPGHGIRFDRERLAPFLVHRWSSGEVL